ncbi:MAG: phosphoribosylanthranilate isomerase [Woeseiaceae bacterium]
MSLLIKICGLRDEQQVAAAVAAGADALGFVFAESARQVTPQRARSISAAVPATVKRVAVMLHPDNAAWREVLRVFAPDVLQADADDFVTLEVPDAVERWPVFREGQMLPAIETTYVYEGANSGRGETVDWSLAARLATHGRMILAGGLGPDNVAAAIMAVRPKGVDVSSGVETSPGMKDSQLINEFINAARAAERSL